MQAGHALARPRGQREGRPRDRQPRRGPGEKSANGHPDGGAWDESKWLECADGKARRIKPGITPLAHGVSGRVVKLRAIGNAIVPQVAAEFIKAFMDILEPGQKSKFQLRRVG